jgi:hypothetical protein
MGLFLAGVKRPGFIGDCLGSFLPFCSALLLGPDKREVGSPSLPRPISGNTSDSGASAFFIPAEKG